MMSTQNKDISHIRLGKNIKVIKKLGEGAFGEIYKAILVKTNFELAIKLEPTECKHPQLFFESTIYKYLHQDTDSFLQGIPQVYFCRQKGRYNMMAMDLLGPSLEDLFTVCGRKFSLKTVLMLGLQMISRIEFMHLKTFLHRDVKPDNFLIGSGRKEKLIYIIDLGLAKRYYKNQQHIEYRNDKSLTGTARYASVNTHLGIEQSRRDDLECIGYIMIYFLKGMLPWQNLRARTKEEKYLKIKQKKVDITVEKLCHGFPEEFTSYLTYCRKLKFDEKPDYEYLKNLLKDLMKTNSYENDFRYDWVIRKEKELEREAAKVIAGTQIADQQPIKQLQQNEKEIVNPKQQQLQKNPQQQQEVAVKVVEDKKNAKK